MTAHIVGIHHIGIVVDDIERNSEFYVNNLGYKSESAIIHEINQKVFVQFLTLGDYRIELIQPDGHDSPVYKFLLRGGGLAHICYETDNISASIVFFRKEYRYVLTSSPKKTCSIKNCLAAFVARPEGDVIELVQLGVTG